MSYLLAFDQGTTSSRGIVFDREGRIASVAQQEFEQLFPQPGWVEHDPNAIWASQIAVAAEAVDRGGLTRRDIAAIGITNQRETTIVWDRKTGQPVYNAIVWQDRRTAGFCDQLKRDGCEPMVREKTGLLIDAYFSGSKIRWILDHVDGVRERAERGELAFGTVDAWLIWKLTDGQTHVTDATNASRTMLFNIHTGDWDDDLLGLLGVPRSMLPEVRSCSEVYGRTSGASFDAEVPIAGIAGDQQAALFGQMCVEPGMVKTTYGTGCFMLLNTGRQAVVSDNQLLTTVAWKIGDEVTYALEGSVFVGGAVVQWLRDGLGLISSSAEVEALAAQVDDTGGVYLVPAFAGLGAPYWDPYARGAIVGISRGTTAAHIARAALCGIAHRVADVLDAMQADAGRTATQMRVDGGASANNLLMQFQADILGVETVRPTCIETTALGAAYLAGLAVGYWDGLDALRGLWRAERTFKPDMDAAQVRESRRKWADAIGRAKGWRDESG